MVQAGIARAQGNYNITATEPTTTPRTTFLVEAIKTSFEELNKLLLFFSDLLARRSGLGQLATGGGGSNVSTYSTSTAADSPSATLGNWQEGSSLLEISASNTFGAAGDVGFAQAGGAAGSLIATAAGSVAVTNVAQNAPAAAIGTTQWIKLTTGVASAGSDQATFNAAIGTATLTGCTSDTSYIGSYYDTTNGVMVVFEVLTAGTIQVGDVIRIIVKVTMTAADYTNFSASDMAIF